MISPADLPEQVMLRLVAVETLAENIKHFVFADPASGALPPFAAGSHIGVQCGDVWNSYSLTNAGEEPTTYEISVLRESKGSGGSRWLHDREPGEMVRVVKPRSGFATVHRARKNLLIAGGIGVTAILSHARESETWDTPYELYYVHGINKGAHEDELADIAKERAHFYTSRKTLWRTLNSVLKTQPVGTHLFICGPRDMIEQVTRRAQELGWPEHRLHAEAFVPPALDPGEPFEVQLVRSQKRLTVPSGVTMLDSLLENGVAVNYLCKQGVCGECRLTLVCGAEIEHNDLYLSDDEKDSGESIMPCVSRSTGSRLEIDL